MAYTSCFTLSILLFLSSQILAQTPAAPAPTSSSTINVTGILDKAGQYAIFIRFLISTQVATQIENQLNNSNQGITVFAPTDNAFNNLKSGTLNILSTQQQVQLILYHVVPIYYTLSTLVTVPNPVRTQSSGQDNGVWGLNFTGEGTQVNVSTGIVVTQINNAVRQEFPLAIYQVDKVLLPYELYGAKPPASSPPPPSKTPSSVSNSTSTAEAPKNGSGSSNGNLRFGFVLGLGVICMGALFF